MMGCREQRGVKRKGAWKSPTGKRYVRFFYGGISELKGRIKVYTEGI